MLSIVMAVVSFLAKFPQLGIDDNAVQQSMWVLRVVPGFAVTWGFSNIHEIGASPAKCAKLNPAALANFCPLAKLMGIEVCCQDCGNGTYCYLPHSAFATDRYGSGREMLYLFFVGIVLFLLLAFFESNVYGLWYRLRSLCLGKRHEGVCSRKSAHDSRKNAHDLCESLLVTGSPRVSVWSPCGVCVASTMWSKFLAVSPH
ncbi:hypothetical protein HPB48_019135 [Haemaphysalis longicornis]|uniref:Uncharacterized protein n=1 Tax=Haemaphysalis longicornis TaxID=44386 RepID=A0A9J6H0B5_HAELO|nr:hypothetical protein HPB48_019135 [Haemaphysalis longicornis]